MISLKRRKEIYDKHYQKHKDRICRKRRENYDPIHEKALRLNVSEDEIKTLFTKFNNKCGICFSKNKLCLDHDHGTGRLRGILCRRCNIFIGHAKDSVKLLKQAIRYLESNGK